MGIISNIRNRIKSEKLLILNKPIELMNNKELNLEFWRRLQEINKTKIIDNRSNQIVEKYLNRETREKEQKEEIIENIFEEAKSYELRKEILKRYSKYIDEENVYTFIRRLSNIEHVEDLNEKMRDSIAKIDNKKDKKKINKTVEIDERQKIYRGIVYSENLEKIDLLKILENESFETFEEIYKTVPEEQKNILIIEMMHKNESFTRDKRFKELILKIPENIIKEEILKGIFRNEQIKDFLEDNIQISVDDAKKFYRKQGRLSPKSSEILYKDNKIYSVDELIDELKYFNDEYSRYEFLRIYLHKTKSEEIEKIIFNNSVDKDIKISILNAYTERLPYKDRLAIFNELDEDIRNRASIIFAKNFYDFNNENQEDIDETEYINEILSQLTNEEIYNAYVINFFETTDIKPDIVFNVLRNNPHYLDELSTYTYGLLNFSDEQIKILYNCASDKAKANMIDLSRRKTNYQDYFSQQYNLSDEVKEDNKDIPEYILVNEKNYFELIKDADKLTLGRLLSMNKYRELLTKEQNIEILKKIENRKIKTVIESYLYKLIPKIIEDSSIQDVKNILLEINSEKLCNAILYSYQNENITTEDIKNELLEISDIKNKTIQIEYINRLIVLYKKSEFNKKGNNRNEKLADKIEQDISNILEELIKKPETSIENKYLYLSSYFYYNESQEKTIELYKYVNKLAEKETYNEFINHKKFKYIAKILPYFYDEKTFNILTKLYEKNHEVIETILPDLLDKKVLDKMNYEVIEFYSRYMMDDSLKRVVQDEKKTIAFINSYNRLNSLKAYPEEDLLKVIQTLAFSKEDELEVIDVFNKQNIDKLIAISQSSNPRVENFNSYEDQIKEDTRRIINEPLSSRKQLIDSIGKRFFNLSYHEMKEIIIKYSKDADIFIKKYENKEILSLEEQNELRSLKIIRNIKEIMNIKDKRAIIDTFNELDKDEEFEQIDFTAKIALDENVRRVFSKDYIKDLYIPKESDKKIIDGIEVYSPKEFNMFVNVVGAYSDFKLVDKENPKKSAVEAWENEKSKKSHIMCTSYIRNSNMSYVKRINPENKKSIIDNIKEIFNIEKEEKKEKDIILGFGKIGTNSIQMSSVADIAIETNGIKSQKAYRHYTFRSADNLSNGTRIMYNEVDIERRLEEDRTNNIKPTYVICFDEISEESKKVANDFKIPIIYINNEEIAKQESKRLEETFEKYKETKEPKLLKDIIVKYMNNSISFSFTRKDLMKEYFNEENMSRKIKEIIMELDKQYKFGDKQKAEEGLYTLYNAFNDENEKYLYGNLDPALSNCSSFDIKQFAFDLKKRLEKMGVSQKQNNTDEIDNNYDRFNSYQDSMLKKIKQVEGDNNYER